MKKELKENKVTVVVICILILCLVAGWVIYTLFGHQFIRAMYEGALIGPLNRVIENYFERPVEFYFNWIDSLLSFYTVLAVIFLIWLLAISFIKDKILKKCLFIYLVLGTLLFFVRLGRVSQPENILDAVFYGTALAPNLYRVLVSYLAFFLRSIVPNLSWLDSARIWNFVFIVSTFPLFHMYINKWFKRKISFLITITFGCLLPISFQFDYPSDFLGLVVFIIGYMLIRDKKEFFLYPLIFLATLNRETAVFLVLAYFVSNVRKKDFLRVAVRSFILFIFWLIPFIGLRAIRGIKPYRCSFFMISSNIKEMGRTFLLDGRFFDLLFFLFLFILIYIVFGQERENSFLKRNIITAAIIFAIGFCIALIGEIRIFYPILPIIIPLAFYPLFGKKNNMYGPKVSKI